MKKWLLFTILALTATLYGMHRKYQELKIDRDRVASNVEVLLFKNKEYKLRDSLNVTSVNGLTLKVAELEQLRVDDQKLIRELKIRPKDVQTIIKTSIVKVDSLVFVIDTVGCFHHKDKWIEVNACVGDSLMTVNNKDSISQVIYPVYKKKFLWFRWGLKGMRQEIINHNPHTKVAYSEMINLTK